MVDFNPGLSPTHDPDYKGESRLDQGAFVDRVGAAAVENGRRALNVFAKAADSVIDTVNWGVEKQAENALKQGVEPIRNEQGGDTYGLENQPQNTAQVPGMTPPALGKYAEGVTKLQAQYDQGVITDSRYYEQLEVLTRQVKSRFPGYEDHVDQTIRKLTGVTPANALREARMAEMKATASEAQRTADKHETFLHQNTKYLKADWRTRPFEENEADIREGQAHELKQENVSRDLSIAAAKRGAQDAETKQIANKLVTNEMSEFRRTSQPIIDQAIRLADEKKTMDPQEAEGLSQAYEFNLREAVHKRLAPLNLPPEEYNRAMGMAMEDTKLFRQTLISGDASLLKATKLFTESQANDQWAQVVSTNEVAARVNVLSKMPQSVQNALVTKFDTKIAGQALDLYEGKAPAVSPIPGGAAPNPEQLPKPVQGILQKFKLDDLTHAAFGPGDTPLGELEAMTKLSGGASATATQAYLTDKYDILTNKNIPDDIKRGVVDKMFGEKNAEFLKHFTTASDKAGVFRLLTAPGVMQEVQRLGGSQYDQYSNWVKQSFHHVFKKEIDNLAEVPNRPFVNLSFNESTGKFLLVPTEEGRRVADEEARKAGKPSLVGTMNAVERLYNQAPLEKSVNELNAAMASVQPLIKNEGFTFQDEVKNLIHFEATHDKKNATLWQSFLKNAAIGGALYDKAKETFGGANINFSEASGAPGGKNPLMEMISLGESGSNYNRLVDTPTHPKEAPLTGMTIREVLTYQKGMLRAGNASSAAGKYQVVSKTLKGLVDNGVVNMNDKYDEATQDKIANALLEGRGYKDYLEGRKSLNAFIKDLGEEWEIIKVNPSLRKKVMAELANEKLAYAD